MDEPRDFLDLPPEQLQRVAEALREATRPRDAEPDAPTARAAAKGRAEMTDAGNAQRFIRQHGEDVRFVPEWGWMVWDGKRWRRDDLEARARMLQTARNIHAEAADEPDKRAQGAITAWARKSQSAPRLQGALWCAQPGVAARTDDFDQEPWLLPVANGTLDLRTGELHAHRREHMLTRLAPVYFDKAATCPTWDKFLQRVLPDADVRAFVQRLAGYSLTGLTTEQKLAFLYGSGRNGKSVFIETLGALIGEYHTATRIESLSISQGGGIPNDVAALAGARLVTVSETPEGSRMNESLIKDLTGGDTITARFLRHEFFQFKPQFKMWIRGNHKPQIRGTDDGIWRRLLLIPFTVQIPLEEVDPTLPERLIDELPGILAWAVRGCLEWQQDGLMPPESVAAAVAAYRAEMDTLGDFIEACCVVSPNAKVPASALYSAYRHWCEESGHYPVNTTRFGTALGERGFVRKKQGTIRWVGIGLMETGRLDGLDGCPSSPDSRTRDGGNAEIGSGPSNCPRCGGSGCR